MKCVDLSPRLHRMIGLVRRLGNAYGMFAPTRPTGTAAAPPVRASRTSRRLSVQNCTHGVYVYPRRSSWEKLSVVTRPAHHVAPASRRSAKGVKALPPARAADPRRASCLRRPLPSGMRPRAHIPSDAYAHAVSGCLHAGAMQACPYGRLRGRPMSLGCWDKRTPCSPVATRPWGNASPLMRSHITSTISMPWDFATPSGGI